MSRNVTVVKSFFKLKYRIFIEWALCFSLQIFELVPVLWKIFPVVVEFPMIFIGTTPARNSIKDRVEVDVTSSAFFDPVDVVLTTVLQAIRFRHTPVSKRKALVRLSFLLEPLNFIYGNAYITNCILLLAILVDCF